MSAIVTISMVTTPLLVMLAQRMTVDVEDTGEGLDAPHKDNDHVIIAGFGRMGQIVSQVLLNSGIRVTAIDGNPAHIRNAERFGFKVYYGDASRLDILMTAGAADARAVILCMDNPTAVNQAVLGLRETCPGLTIIACAHDRMHEIALQPLEPDVIVRETLESSIVMAREALARMGHEAGAIDDYVEQFRKRDRERLLAQRDYGADAGKELLHARYTRPSDD